MVHAVATTFIPDSYPPIKVSGEQIVNLGILVDDYVNHQQRYTPFVYTLFSTSIGLKNFCQRWGRSLAVSIFTYNSYDWYHDESPNAHNAFFWRSVGAFALWKLSTVCMPTDIAVFGETRLKIKEITAAAVDDPNLLSFQYLQRAKEKIFRSSGGNHREILVVNSTPGHPVFAYAEQFSKEQLKEKSFDELPVWSISRKKGHQHSGWVIGTLPFATAGSTRIASMQKYVDQAEIVLVPNLSYLEGLNEKYERTKDSDLLTLELKLYRFALKKKKNVVDMSAPKSMQFEPDAMDSDVPYFFLEMYLKGFYTQALQSFSFWGVEKSIIDSDKQITDVYLALGLLKKTGIFRTDSTNFWKQARDFNRAIMDKITLADSKVCVLADLRTLFDKQGKLICQNNQCVLLKKLK